MKYYYYLFCADLGVHRNIQVLVLLRNDGVNNFQYKPELSTWELIPEGSTWGKEWCRSSGDFESFEELLNSISNSIVINESEKRRFMRECI